MASQDWFDKDFYKVLGVSKDVTQADLKKTYRKLARKYHPDSNPGDAAAEAKFKEISEANSVLSDPEQRKEYDAVRAMGGGARFTAGGAGGQRRLRRRLRRHVRWWQRGGQQYQPAGGSSTICSVACSAVRAAVRAVERRLSRLRRSDPRARRRRRRRRSTSRPP